MAFADMNPANLGGTLVLLLLFAALLPAFRVAVDAIVAGTSGITEYMAYLIIPMIALAIISNLFTSDDRRGR